LSADAFAGAPAAGIRDPYADGVVRHPRAFLVRRFLNWFPLGVAYAMLYMGRYNLNVAKRELGDLMTKDDFGWIFGVGTFVYGFAFVINGPLTERIEGRRATLIGLAGAFLANLAMGLYLRAVLLSPDPRAHDTVTVLSVLYAVNMYFQSFGAVSIVKVNSSWFHVRERGSFSGIFGVMISSGIYFAYDVNQRVINWVKADLPKGEPIPVWVVFFLPAALLFTLWVIEALLLRDHPSHAGHQDIETGSAQVADDGAPMTQMQVLGRILRNPIIMTVAAIEFCTGVLRQGIMQWFPFYADEQARAIAALGRLGAATSADQLAGWRYTLDNWGLILFIAGVTGGLFAGFVSDRLFHSRRAPAAALLYGLIALCTAVMVPALAAPWVMGGLAFFLSLAVIGTHGLLSGTATMDFGGKKGTATAVGVIDGFVYLGTGVQSLALGYITTIGRPDPVGADWVRRVAAEHLDARGLAVVPTEVGSGWAWWPVFMLPFALTGLALLIKIWHAIPNGKKASH
jgi:OPA family glycerol-3-phosphate transporter-like MFS transporter